LSKLGNLGNNKTAYADGDGGLIIETKVDLSDFIAETQAQYIIEVVAQDGEITHLMNAIRLLPYHLKS